MTLGGRLEQEHWYILQKHIRAILNNHSDSNSNNNNTDSHNNSNNTATTEKTTEAMTTEMHLALGISELHVPVIKSNFPYTIRVPRGSSAGGAMC